MATKEHLHELIDRLPDSPETERRLAAAEHELEANGTNEDSAKPADHESPSGDAPRVDISAIFNLGASGVSDVSSNVDKYLGDSLWQEHLRTTGQSDRAR